MKIDVKSIPGQLKDFANRVSKNAILYIRDKASDTFDMMKAVTVTEVTEKNGVYECTVFVDRTSLANFRPMKYKYKRGLRKGKPYPIDLKYPIYVHQGTSKMKARPYFDIAYEQVKKEFTDIMPTIKVENNDNK